MGLLRIPTKAYQDLVRLLGLDTRTGVRGIHDEVFPTQDMNRILQSHRIQRTTYVFSNTPAVDFVNAVQWTDFSDWAEVVVDGRQAAADADLPPVDHDRYVTSVSLEISGTIASYVGLTVLRVHNTILADTGIIAKYGANTDGLLNPIEIGPRQLPLLLALDENGVSFSMDVSGAGNAFHVTIEMISADPGIMALLPGV